MPTATFPLGPLQTNSYIFHNNKTAIAIDVGGEPTPMLEYLKKHNLNLAAILITHRHFDHIYGVSALSKETKAKVYTPKGDDCLINDEISKGGTWGFPIVQPFESNHLPDNSTSFDGIECKILQTPGHTPGGVSIYFPNENTLFSGDALFYRSIGRTDFSSGNQDELLRSIHEILFKLPDETIVYPGHGPSTTIGDEKKENPFCGEHIE